MSLYRDEGVVLRTSKLGEADRIITILTRGHGKIRAVANVAPNRTSRHVLIADRSLDVAAYGARSRRSPYEASS